MLTVLVDIGINGAFLTRRWEEPANWMRLTAELGYSYQSFCADVLDPFFSGDRGYQLEAAAQAREAAARYGVTIWDVYTGVATHRFHGLSHSDPRCRKRMQDWIVECYDLCVALGTPRLGGHWDAFSCEVLESPERTAEAWDRIVGTFRDLAVLAQARGLTALYNEQMYIPSEIPWTLEQSERFLREANMARAGAPVLLTLDVGHQAGMHYGLTGADLDYLEWVRRFGAFTEILHLQQTTPDASHHWPFTEEFNQRGHVRIPALLEALEWSHQHADESPLAGTLAPCDTCILIGEWIPGSTKTEERLLQELRTSARYLREFVPEGGLKLSVGS
ncbi:MAG: sugar phosphate isomerase/epimerase [Armatimonadetes bacterium]|nr:sugar phosphate isomerase/epimerase [Armatimonadota bacterium]